MTTDEKIVKALENLLADVKDLKDGQQQQSSVINHIATAIKALATKQDVERLEKEVDKLKQRLMPPRAD